MGKAADIYSLNGNEINGEDSGGVVSRFQEALNLTNGARENFGPSPIDKLRKPFKASAEKCKKLKDDHKDHVHYSVN